ncbi:hypothetical protein Hanom_Chr04g00384031 [Helianthus anomalus]
MDRFVCKSSPGINVGLENSNLHGEKNSRLHASDIFIGDDVTNKDIHNSLESDDVGPGGKVNRPNSPFIRDGQTPSINLGKRSRNDVSPPSIGSTQGPAQRMFYHSQDHSNEPLDLNTLVNINFDEDVAVPVPPVPHRESQANDFQRSIPVDGNPRCSR